MIWSLFTNRRQAQTIRALYGAIVAQARNAVFYKHYAVPDTVNGRFDMIVLHLSLFLDRSEAGDDALRMVGQKAFDLFCAELDGHVREQGTGDLQVPKEMQKFASAFYGRRAAYRDALAEPGNRALESAVMRNIYGQGGEPDAGVARLARYIRAAAESLGRQQDFAGGIIAWPDPTAITADAKPAQTTAQQTIMQQANVHK